MPQYFSIRTGRRRTITVEGIYRVLPKPTNAAATTWTWGTIESRFNQAGYYSIVGVNPTRAVQRPMPGYPRTLVDTAYDFAHRTITADAGNGHPITQLIPYASGGRGTYRLSIDVEEWAYLTSNATLVDRVTGRDAWSLAVIDLLRPGGAMSCTITCDGYTVSDTRTIQPGVPVPMDYRWQTRYYKSPSLPWLDHEPATDPDNWVFPGASDVWCAETLLSDDVPIATVPIVYSRDATTTWRYGGRDRIVHRIYSIDDGTTHLTGEDYAELMVYRGPVVDLTFLGRAWDMTDIMPEPLTAEIIGKAAGAEVIDFQGGFVKSLEASGGWGADEFQNPSAGRQFLTEGDGLGMLASALSVRLQSASLTAQREDSLDPVMPLLAWPFDPGITMQQAASWDVDALNDTGPGGELLGAWLGGQGEIPTVDAGIRIDTGGSASSLYRTYTYRAVNLGGYRYLSVTISGPAAALTVSITDMAGYVKTWDADYSGTPLAPGTFILDLCCPSSETAATDDTDSWREGDGPYFGVTGARKIEIGGLAASSTYRLSALQGTRL